jgi:hypothetical protein
MILDGSIQSTDLAQAITIQQLTVAQTFSLPGGVTWGSTTDASSYSVGGTLLSMGGGAVAKRFYVGGGTFLQSTTDASSSSLGGALTVSGGAAIAKKLFVGDAVLMQGLQDAGSATSGGALTVMGGASFGKRVFIGDTLTLSQTADASSSSIGGALTIAGGAAVGTLITLCYDICYVLAYDILDCALARRCFFSSDAQGGACLLGDLLMPAPVALEALSVCLEEQRSPRVSMWALPSSYNRLWTPAPHPCREAWPLQAVLVWLEVCMSAAPYLLKKQQMRHRLPTEAA